MIVLDDEGNIDQSITKDLVTKSQSGSPETYFGASRNTLFKNGVSGVVGEQDNLIVPTELEVNILYLSGNWNITNEYAENKSTNAGITYKYAAKDVFFVAQADRETVVEVLRDGKALGLEAGQDIIKNPDGKTILRIKEARLYEIIKDREAEFHTLELKILNPGLEVFTFTFG